MPSVQMNVRIDEQQKTAGDAVFALVGYSPTEVVRAVWGFAARNAAEPSAVKSLLADLRAPLDSAQEEERVRRRKLLEESHHIYQRFLDSVGVDALPPVEEGDIRSQRQQAYAERLMQKDARDGR